MTTVVLILGSLALVGVAAVHHLGWLDGLGVTAAIYLLMPQIRTPT